MCLCCAFPQVLLGVRKLEKNARSKRAADVIVSRERVHVGTGAAVSLSWLSGGSMSTTSGVCEQRVHLLAAAARCLSRAPAPVPR